MARNERIRVCVVTGARSEYGLMRWVMRELADSPRFHLSVAVTGSHLSEEYGSTYREIERDGFEIAEKVGASLDTTSSAALATAVGAWTQGFASAFERLRPDLVLVMGDRYELLSVGAACTLMSIPLGHVSGGEITEGAIDDQIRHSITKLAHLHFAANETYADRIRQMGEEPWRVCVSGEPGLDNMRRLPLASRRSLERDLGLDLSRPTALVTFHPVTHEPHAAAAQARALVSALQAAGLQYVITYPNADLGGKAVIGVLKRFVARYPKARLVQNLGTRRYLGLMRHVRLMAGNSSSALVEAPSFNLPAVNIGARQAGRMRARNVIDVDGSAAGIREGIRSALAYDRDAPCPNPYGDGDSSRRVRTFIERTFDERRRPELLRKKFVDRAAPVSDDRVGGGFELPFAPFASPARAPLEDFLHLGPHHAWLASGRAAFRFVLEELAPLSGPILLPDHLCGDVLLPVVKEAGAAHRWYRVRADLSIDEEDLLRQAPGAGAALLIDYFGMSDHAPLARSLRRRWPGLILIEDRVQSLYGPARPWADYDFASLRKFLPVPDGAFVRARRPLRRKAPGSPRPDQGTSALVAGGLKREFLGGLAPRVAAVEAAFVEAFARASRELSSEPSGMTSFSRTLAERLPLDEYAERRRTNYRFLARELAGTPGLEVLRPRIGAAIPLALPVAIGSGRRDALRARLRADRIYCPVHWPQIAELRALPRRDAGRLAATLLSLPVDQRYDPASLSRMIPMIKEFLAR